MRNLAGDPNCNVYITDELTKAGIHPYNSYVPSRLEVPSSITGILGSWTFTRAWYYWVAESSRIGIPRDIAEEFNKQWGEFVRVDGFAGGKDVDRDQIYLYHIDSQDGLNAFSSLVKSLDGADQAEAIKRNRDSAFSRVSALHSQLAEALEELSVATIAVDIYRDSHETFKKSKGSGVP
jgi:hypothetical protein